MTTETQHTPTPWNINTSLLSSGYDVYQPATNRLIANCGGWDENWNLNQNVEKKANARFIVQACNSFEGLLAEATAVLKDIESGLLENDSRRAETNRRRHIAVLKDLIAKATTPRNP